MNARQARPLRESIEEYGRGIAGGLLFSLPLLYTMEVWWRGFTASPEALLAFFGATFLALLGYNRYGGMPRLATRAEVVIDSIEEMGLGLVIAAGILYLMGRIQGDMPFAEILGKITVEAMTVAIGVSVGTAQLGGNGGGKPANEESDVGTASNAAETTKADAEPQGKQEREPPDPKAQLVMGACGAILIASNVAPTEEIVQIGVESHPAKLVGIALLSLTVCTLVYNFSGFVGADRHVHRGDFFWASYGVISSYAMALVISALMLWFFGRFQGLPLGVKIAETVVLGFPAALGASAGRLLIQSQG